MTIRQQGGIFGRNPAFNDVSVEKLGVGTNAPLGDVQFNKPNPDFYMTSVNGGQTDIFFGSVSSPSEGNIKYSTFDNSMRIWTNGAEAVRIEGDGDLNVRIGNVIMASGKGIDFSATSGTGTSELFSDYEEGTFSPVFADAISGGNLASTSNTYAQYTKVGNVVHCTISMLNINTTGLTAGNTAYIQGLPFATVSAGTSRFFPIYVRADGITSTVGIQGWILANAVTYIGLENVTTTGKANLLVSAISSGVSDLAVSFSYFTS